MWYIQYNSLRYLVIKTLSYFPLQCALNSTPVIQAALEALADAGIETKENSFDCDAVMIWSVLWHGRLAANQAVYQHYINQNKPVIIFDIGMLRREVTWKVAVKNINAHGFYGNKENLDWDRPKFLGISSQNKSKAKTKPSILIASQHARSLQVQSLESLESWINKQIETLKKFTDRPIVVRPHPRSRLIINKLCKDVVIETPQSLSNTYDNYDLDVQCHAVVNYNSSPGILAAIAGTRPVVDVSSLAWPVSVSLNNIEKPYDIDRERWLVEICHTEYTVEEIKQGLWLKRILPALM